jgi:hypothetical protein
MKPVIWEGQGRNYSWPVSKQGCGIRLQNGKGLIQKVPEV